MTTTKRLSLLVLGIIVGTVGITASATAQNYPWCAQYSGNFGGAMNCGFVSFDQCMATVSGIGGFCIVNNTYRPIAGPVSTGHPARKHHVRKNS